jgi:hypothetical protein
LLRWSPVLTSTIAKVYLSEEEAAPVEPKNLLISPRMWPRFHKDVKVFMEACLSHAKKKIPTEMIVTNDHKFFSIFLQSSCGGRALRSDGCTPDPGRSEGEAVRGTCSWDVSSPDHYVY